MMSGLVCSVVRVSAQKRGVSIFRCKHDKYRLSEFSKVWKEQGNPLLLSSWIKTHTTKLNTAPQSPTAIISFPFSSFLPFFLFFKIIHVQSFFPERSQLELK